MTFWIYSPFLPNLMGFLSKKNGIMQIFPQGIPLNLQNFLKISPRLVGANNFEVVGKLDFVVVSANEDVEPRGLRSLKL